MVHVSGETAHMWLEKALSVVEKASAFIYDHLDAVNPDDVVEKEANSLVSFVDQTAERILVEGLGHLLPDASFITEEETTPQGNAPFTWVIDPLDGTTNFLHSIPYFSVSVALLQEGQPLLGIVREVMHGEVFTAIRGQGAWCNKKQIRVTQRTHFQDIIVGTGFPYRQEKTKQAHFYALKDVLDQTRGVRRIGSAALDLCQVACGRFGGFYELALNPWDIAAGALIVREAGGFVSDFRGGDSWMAAGEILASAPQFRQHMLDITRHFHEKT